MIKKILKKVLFVFALFFAWLNFSLFFGLYYSPDGQPLANNLSLTILAILLIFTPIYFYLSFRKKKSS